MSNPRNSTGSAPSRQVSAELVVAPSNGSAPVARHLLASPASSAAVPNTPSQLSPGSAPGQPQEQSAPRLFQSFFAAGFECSTHISRPGRRLDLVHSTGHDRFAAQDYRRLSQQGIRLTREGVRWHLVEPAPGKYDFSSVAPIVAAARAENAQVIWDLCHFGWPDHLDLFSRDFPARLAEYGVRFVQWLAAELDRPAFIVPVNEISFFSWAAGDEASMYPFEIGRGFELKRQLVAANIQTIKAIRSVAPQTRFLQVEPIIHVVADPSHPEDAHEAEAYRRSQYQAMDMLCGKACPELGGTMELLDITGVNFYPHNQWFYNLKKLKRVRRFRPVQRQNPLYRPFREMLFEVYERYHRPVFVAETGAENRRRANWLKYVCEEAQHAIQAGVPVQGICLYPILNHPGWVDDRHCHNGLWDYPDEHGQREIYKPLAAELRRWQKRFASPAPRSAHRTRGPLPNLAYQNSS